jgi:hypothetical protein
MVTKTSPSSWYAFRDGKSWTNLVEEPQWSRRQTKHEGFTGTVSYGDNFGDWKARIRRQQNATTVLSGKKTQNTNVNDGYAFLKWRGPTGTINYRELRGALINLDHVSTLNPVGFEITSVKNQVIIDINSQIRSAQKSMQGLVALGELGESVRMINSLGRDIFVRTDKYLRSLNKIANSLKPHNVLRTVSERWLEYRFGIKPLVSDVASFYDACDRNRFGRPPVQHIRASGKSLEKDPKTVVITSELNHLMTTTIERSRWYGCRIYGVVGLDPNQAIPPFSREFGITLDEFVPSLYELIPYSFLVDYFINLGAIVDAYSLNKSNVSWLAIGELREGEVKLSGVLEPNLTVGNVILDSIFHPCTPLTRIVKQVDRAMFSVGSLIPDLEFRIPGTSTRWLNISALTHLHLDTSIRLRSRLRL